MTTHKVAIITGASGGIGAGLVAGYRKRNWAVVASSRTIKRSQEPDLVTGAGDITGPATAGRIVETALDRFGRIDTLVNSPARSCTSTAARSPVTLNPLARTIQCQYPRVHGRDDAARTRTVETSTDPI